MNTTFLTATLEDTIEAAFGYTLMYAAFIWLFKLAVVVGVAALIVWIAKKIWYAGSRNNTQNTQQHARSEYKPSADDMKWSPTGWYWDEKKQKWVSPDYEKSQAKTNSVENEEKKWVYNEMARMFVDAEQTDPAKNRAAYERTRQKWQAYKEEEEAKERAEWEVREQEKQRERHYRAVAAEINRPVYLSPEEQELSKQIHLNRDNPTFEEWKAQQLKKTPDGEYRRDYINIEQDDSVPKP